MRAQLLISALTTAMLSGLLGMWLLSSVAARSEQTFLDEELRISEQAVRRPWRSGAPPAEPPIRPWRASRRCAIA